MSTPSKIAPKLLRAAGLLKSAFAANEQAPIGYYYKGGFAVIAQMEEPHARTTSDLDVDIQMKPDDPKVLAFLDKHHITVKYLNESRLSLNVPESKEGAKDAVSVDVAVNPKLSALSAYFEEHKETGVCIAGPGLLLLEKIKSFSDRPENNTSKLANDVHDINWASAHITTHGGNIPKSETVLSAEDWSKFWARITAYDNEIAGTLQEDLSSYGLEEVLEYAPKAQSK